MQGWATAPIRQQASIAYAHSGRFPTTVITTSPRPTPRAASAPASRAERSATSPNEISRRSPSRAIATSASRDGSAASTTSATKLIQVATSARRG